MANNETQPTNTPEDSQIQDIKRIPLLHLGLGHSAVAKIVPRPADFKIPESRGLTLGTAVPDAAFDEV